MMIISQDQFQANRSSVEAGLNQHSATQRIANEDPDTEEFYTSNIE
jgi:hypothetical protein